MSINENNQIQGLLMKTTLTLRNSLDFNENIVSYNQSNSKEYFIASVMDDLLNFFTALIRWEEVFSEEVDNNNIEDPVGKSIGQAVINEIDMYRRKNVEILCKLILFADTNSEPYYKHFIVLKEYNNEVNKLKDYKEFFEIEPLDQIYEIDGIAQTLILNMSNVDEKLCWFVDKNAAKKNIKGIRVKVGEASTRTIIKLAIMKSTVPEKIALGLTYDKYSNTSQKIHSSVILNKPELNAIKSTIQSELLTTCLILNRCLLLDGKIKNKETDIIFNLIKNLENSKSRVTPLVANIFSLNDYVYTQSDSLGKIVEIINSSYGYNSFKIMYITDKPFYAGDFGYYPAHFITRIYSRDQLEQALSSIKDHIQNQIINVNLSKLDFNIYLDSSIKKLWEGGLREKLVSGNTETLKATAEKARADWRIILGKIKEDGKAFL